MQHKRPDVRTDMLKMCVQLSYLGTVHERSDPAMPGQGHVTGVSSKRSSDYSEALFPKGCA